MKSCRKGIITAAVKVSGKWIRIKKVLGNRMNNEVGMDGKGWMENKFITQESRKSEEVAWEYKSQGKVKLMMET